MPDQPNIDGLLSDDAATERLGAALGRALAPGDAVFLSGPLGAGKSALARAAILARLADLGRREEAPSPTYSLVQIYDINGAEIRHADLYRLSDPEEAVELGLLDEPDSAILLIEWGEKLEELAPARRLEIRLDIPAGRKGRRIVVRPIGAGWARVEATLREALE